MVGLFHDLMLPRKDFCDIKFLSPSMGLSFEIEQKWRYFCQMCGIRSPIGVVTHFQDKTFFHRYDCIFGNYNFTRRCGLINKLLCVDLSPSFDFIYYVCNTDLPTDKLRLCLLTHIKQICKLSCVP